MHAIQYIYMAIDVLLLMFRLLLTSQLVSMLINGTTMPGIVIILELLVIFKQGS